MLLLTHVLRVPTTTTCILHTTYYILLRRLYAVALLSSIPTSECGTRPVIGAVCSGEVPHVTVGAMSSAWMYTSLSKIAPTSEDKPRQ